MLFVLLLVGAYAASAHLARTRHVGNALVGLTLPAAYLTAARFQEKVRTGHKGAAPKAQRPSICVYTPMPTPAHFLDRRAWS